jgi:hypothetical protein
LVCEKAAIAILFIKMTAPGYEPGIIEACFERMSDCRIFERQVVHQMIEASGNKIAFQTRCRPKLRSEYDVDE